MFIGRPTSVAAAPVFSNSETSPESVSAGRHRRIMPMGRLILPEAPTNGSARVLGRAPGGVGSTIRCVERVDWPVPGLLGLRPVVPVRGTASG